MSEFHGAAALVAACTALLCGSTSAQTVAASGVAAVTVGGPAARDNERVRILRDELAREQVLATDAVKRRAERLAAADARGAEEADLARERAAGNLRTEPSRR